MSNRNQRKQEKADLAKAFFYIALFAVAICCLPALWELIVASTIVVLQGVAIMIILAIALALLDSSMHWVFTKEKDGTRVWTFA